MKSSRLATILWLALIVILVVVEIAEITHVFTIPIQNAIGDPLTIVIALIFTTIVALVGAIFIGIYLSARILSPTGFTPFEEEMLRMRADVHQVRRDMDDVRARLDPDPSKTRTDPDDREAP